MDMQTGVPDHGGMIKRKRKPKVLPPLYIGQWIRALGYTPAEVARGVPINEGYLSQLIAGKVKKNPSAAMLVGISRFLNVPLDYLYQPPPDREFIQQAATLDPLVLSRLRSIRH
jgi:transcriptional regulator with XRE-family HTH domain